MSSGPIIALLAVASALGFALAANRWVRWRADRTPLDLSGLSGRVVFLSDDSCRRCPAARAALVTAGVDFEELRYGDDPKRFRATGAPAVPLLVVRAPDGSEMGRIAGEVHPRELRALLKRAGL